MYLALLACSTPQLHISWCCALDPTLLELFPLLLNT